MPKAPPTLIADIGGTNARFALVAEGSAVPEVVGTVPTQSYGTPIDAIHEIVHRGAGIRPERAVLAVAAPMGGPEIKLTNGPWTFEPRKMLAELGLKELIFLNDFEAQALALPRYAEHDLAPIGGGEAIPGATKLVIGPGTGLGAAALINSTGWRPVGGEGGHIERAPLTERERQIWPHISREGERVSAEAILSGPGLMNLYRAVAGADGIAPVHTRPNEVVESGLAGDRTARETLELFGTHLGRYAGDLALVFMARGGVYVSGGIGMRLASFLQTSGFRDGFDEKPPYRHIMKSIAVSVVVHRHAGLLGLAGMVQFPHEYSLPLAGRRWRAEELA